MGDPVGYFVIIRGPLAVGKSTVAKKLANALGAEYVGIDRILEEHKLDYVDGEECVPLKNFLKANEIILPEMKKRIAQGRIVVFDGNFYFKEPIEHLIGELGEHYVFTLKASVDECIDRDVQRGATHGPDAARAVHNLVSRFDYGMMIETKDKTADDVVEEIMKQLPDNP